MTTSLDPLQSAKEELSSGNYLECLRQLIFAFNSSPDNKDCYSLAVLCLKQMNAGEESALFEAALANWDDPKPFFELGYHFIDRGQDRLAIPMLERSLSLAPGNANIALELAIALCGQFQPERAREALSGRDLKENFWIAYQFYWASLLCGIAENCEPFIKESRRQFLAQSASHEIKGALYALDKLDEMRIRLALIPSPPKHIMHWHFIQYGAAILDYFDDREGQTGLEVAGGRWVYVGLSKIQLALTLNKLKLYLETINHMPKLVLSMPDKDSCIIANAAARIFDLPLTVIPDPTNSAWEESLLVAANNWNLAGAPTERILKGQTVFSFNLNWLERGPNTPDVSGMLSQYCVFPWSKDRLLVDPESKTRVETSEDMRPAEEIAADFADEKVEIEAEFQDNLSFYKQHAAYLKGGKLGGNKRWRFITDSAVPGSYFC